MYQLTELRAMQSSPGFEKKKIPLLYAHLYEEMLNLIRDNEEDALV